MASAPTSTDSLPDARLLVPPELACRALEAILAYDLLRLRTYASRPLNPEHIQERTFGSATALVFPRVGYFNQVYQLRETDLAHLPAMVRLYRDLGLGLKVNVAPDADRECVFTALADVGFRVVDTQARLVRPITGEEEAPRLPHGVTLAPVSRAEHDVFFELYLEAFGADPARRAEALANMRLLHGAPGLVCRLARNGDVPVGLCMLHLHRATALLCAGATSPHWRGLGIQGAMIQARLRLGHRAGCDLAVSWTDAGSRSHANLLAAGFETVCLDPVWFLGPRDSCRC